jgi:hypothetical protein
LAQGGGELAEPFVICDLFFEIYRFSKGLIGNKKSK